VSPRFSIFSPSHNPQWLNECYESVARQTWGDWEWIVLLNGGARWYPARPDERVRVVEAPGVEGVGAAKSLACEVARGEILVELDHDDILSSDCLASLRQAFMDNPEASLVYSNTAQITANGQREDSRFDASHGWTYYNDYVDGRDVQAYHAMEPTPHNCSLIWYSPNHVRAFRRTAYDAAGGYDSTRRVCDDADLMCRLYQQGPFIHIDRCLYLQRIHPTMTQRQKADNAFIQTETVNLYDRHIQANALVWAQREGLLALDFGAAHARPEGFIGVDCRAGPGVDLVHEFPAPLDMPDSSVGLIRAADFLEHVADKVAMMDEIYRILAPGGLLLSLTPSTDGRGAFQDPTHVSFWNENSFWYWTQAALRNYVPDIKGAFQVSRLTTGFPSEWHEKHHICYVTANLIALKEPMPRYGGRILI
jgi:glycosyltransferase involved in cell wall biosynthesis